MWGSGPLGKQLWKWWQAWNRGHHSRGGQKVKEQCWKQSRSQSQGASQARYQFLFQKFNENRSLQRPNLQTSDLHVPVRNVGSFVQVWVCLRPLETWDRYVPNQYVSNHNLTKEIFLAQNIGLLWLGEKFVCKNHLHVPARNGCREFCTHLFVFTYIWLRIFQIIICFRGSTKIEERPSPY